MYAEDVLGQKVSLLEQISTIKISNIPIGKQVVGLLNANDKSVEQEASDPLEKAVLVRFCDSHDAIVVVLSGCIQVWRFAKIHDWTDPMLIHSHALEPTDSVVDVSILSIASNSDIRYATAIKSQGNQRAPSESYQLSLHQVDSLALSGTPAPVKSISCAGKCQSILCNRYAVVVAHLDGTVRVFSVDKLMLLAEFCSLAEHSVVMDVSARWLVVERTNTNNSWNEAQSKVSEWITGKPSVNGINSTRITDVSGNLFDNSEDVMRVAVSSMYEVGKFGWNSVSPIIQQVNGSNPVNGTQRHNASDSSNKHSACRGGCLEVFDLNVVPNDGTVGVEPMTPQSLVKFIAHGNNLSCVKFSSSGLKVASSDVNGQVIHIHSLCKASSNLQGVPKLHSHMSSKDNHTQYVQLLYKIHRGVTLVSIFHLNFSEDDSVLSVVSANSTLHMFGLPSTTSLDKEQSADGGITTNAALASVSGATQKSPSENSKGIAISSSTTGTSTEKKEAKGKHGSKIAPKVINNNSVNGSSDQNTTNPSGVESNGVVVPSQVDISNLLHSQQPRTMSGDGVGDSMPQPTLGTNMTHTVYVHSNTRAAIPERFILPVTSEETRETAPDSESNGVRDSKGSDSVPLEESKLLWNKYAFAAIRRDQVKTITGSKSAPEVEYAVVCVTSQGYVCRFACRRLASPSAVTSMPTALGSSPPVNNTVNSSANNTNTALTSSGSNSTSSSLGSSFASAISASSGMMTASTGLPLHDFRETNRWDLLLSTSKTGSLVSAGVSRSINSRDKESLNVTSTKPDTQRISWLGSVTQFDHLVNKHQTDLAIGTSPLQVPCWRRHNIRLSITSPNNTERNSVGNINPSKTCSTVPAKVTGLTADISTIPVVLLQPETKSLMTLDTHSRISLHDYVQKHRDREESSLPTSTGSADRDATQQYRSGVARAVSVQSSVSRDAATIRDREEFNRKREELRQLRLQQANAHNIELFEMDEEESDWIGCEPHHQSKKPLA